jgi:hypothetical protein
MSSYLSTSDTNYSLGTCIREGSLTGAALFSRGAYCGGTGIPPTATPIPTPTATPTTDCRLCTVTNVFSSGNITYTTCSGDSGSSFLGAGTTNYSLGCIRYNTASGAASFSYGNGC